MFRVVPNQYITSDPKVTTLTYLAGQTVSASGRAFKAWLFDYICVSTPLNPRDHGLRLDWSVGATPTYYKECFVHLSQMQFERVSRVLEEAFTVPHPPAGSVSAWGMAAAARGLRIGHVFVLKGGKGKGEAVLETHTHTHTHFLGRISQSHIIHYAHNNAATTELNTPTITI